ncbi:unnamed protein product [Rhodiola kirilowii]
MSMVGELKYFLGLQVAQGEDGTRIHQQKYVKEILKKFGMESAKTCATPMSPNDTLAKDESSLQVDLTLYRGMIGSLLYLTASRPDILFSVCLCARFQADPRETHVKAVMRILRYLKVGMHIRSGPDRIFCHIKTEDRPGPKPNRSGSVRSRPVMDRNVI